MKKEFQKVFMPLLFVFIGVVLNSSKTDSKPTLYVIGDSTASLYDADSYPRTGWAQVLQPFFNADSVMVNDKAASGRSSRSYYLEKGKWDVVSQLFKPGDYLFIQFAHNDEKTDEYRHTDPATTFKDYLNIYINRARDKGAYPVLLSSIPRNNWSGSVIQQAHKPYTVAMKQVADSANVPFIDMEAITMAYLNSKGKTYATDSVYNNLKAGVWPNYTAGNSDGTHLQEKGAFELCQVLISDLLKVEGFPEIDKLKANTQKAIRISAMPNPNLKGKITGNGIFKAGSKITLKTAPVSGYEFIKWTLENDTTTYSTSSTISFDTDSANIEFVAHLESILGKNEIHRDNDFKIYPNPANHYLNINVKEENWQVEIYNSNGALLLTANNQKNIDVSSFLNGFYLVKVSTKSNQFSSQIQISK